MRGAEVKRLLYQFLAAGTADGSSASRGSVICNTYSAQTQVDATDADVLRRPKIWILEANASHLGFWEAGWWFKSRPSSCAKLTLDFQSQAQMTSTFTVLLFPSFPIPPLSSLTFSHLSHVYISFSP